MNINAEQVQEPPKPPTQTQQLVFLGAYALIIYGATVPPDSGMANVGWFVALGLGCFALIGVLGVLSIITKNKKRPVEQREKIFFDIINKPDGTFSPVLRFMPAVAGMACAYAGWWVLATIWLFAALFGAMCHSQRADLKTANGEA